jgi:hypothetical protein
MAMEAESGVAVSVAHSDYRQREAMNSLLPVN